MTRVAARTALVLAVLATVGCVEAVPGLPLAAPASDAPPFGVRVVPPSDEWRGVGLAGALDAVVRTDVVTVSGWVPAEAGKLLVVASAPVELVSQRRLRRPDAAKALGRSRGRDELGFELVLRPRAEMPAGVCIVFRPEGAAERPVRLAGTAGGDCGLDSA